VSRQNFSGLGGPRYWAAEYSIDCADLLGKRMYLLDALLRQVGRFVTAGDDLQDICLSFTMTNEKNLRGEPFLLCDSQATRHHGRNLGKIVPRQATLRIGVLWEGRFFDSIHDESGGEGFSEQFMQGAMIVHMWRRLTGSARSQHRRHVQIPGDFDEMCGRQDAVYIGHFCHKNRIVRVESRVRRRKHEASIGSE
jgi:hypothetical protein